MNIAQFNFHGKMLPLLLGLFIIVLLYIRNRVRNQRLYQLAKKFPGPAPWPILENSAQFIVTDSHGIFMKLLGYVEQYGRFFRLWNGGKFYLFCNDYKDAEVILGSPIHIKKSESYRFIHPWIGDNVLTGSGALWKSHRKVITPAFHFQILNEFLDVFNRKSEIFCQKLLEKDGKQAFDIGLLVKLLALDNVYETAMGINMDIQKNSESDYVLAVKDMCHVANLRFYRVWLMIESIFQMSKYSKIQERALKILHETTDEVIKRKCKGNTSQRVEAKKEIDDDDGVYDNNNKKKAFLDLLLHSPEASNWSRKEFRQEVDTFLFAGHDTVSSALGFAFYCLAQNQEVQEKVYQEQLSIFGKSDRLPTSEDIQEMKYLERTIKEVQRLYPSAPIIGRELEEEMELPGKVIVPKETQINIFIYSVHRDPRIWKNPLKFNPDNFLPEAIQSRPPYTYIPFSAGPRNCLGQKYAMLEMKAAISTAVRKFKFLPGLYEKDSLLLAAEIILVSKTGIHVRVESR